MLWFLLAQSVKLCAPTLFAIGSVEECDTILCGLIRFCRSLAHARKCQPDRELVICLLVC